VSENGWQPIELELVRDGFLARVTRDRHGRWRWAVTELEHVGRWLHKAVQHAFARGYSRSPERAIEMAEAAIVALQEAKKDKPENPWFESTTTTIPKTSLKK